MEQPLRVPSPRWTQLEASGNAQPRRGGSPLHSAERRVEAGAGRAVRTLPRCGAGAWSCWPRACPEQRHAPCNKEGEHPHTLSSSPAALPCATLSVTFAFTSSPSACVTRPFQPPPRLPAACFPFRPTWCLNRPSECCFVPLFFRPQPRSASLPPPFSLSLSSNILLATLICLTI